ncbi:MAG: hypothetical protein HXS48_11040 [Theionarchaea archaeon]|nr:hypothetical protein [Theionarchaea archaeon]
MSKIRVLSIFSVLLISTGMGCLSQFTVQPSEGGSAIDTSQEPLQERYTGEEIHKRIGGFEFTIVPVAVYKASVLVICVKYYNADEVDELAPIDLCVVWGKLAKPKYLQHFTCTQTDRGCRLTSRTESYLDDSYVGTHFTNMHIIPANETILEAIKRIKGDQAIVLEGFLVNVYSGGAVIWETSLIWKDPDSGSCEVLYVTKVKIGSTIYE